ncbi:MAG: efflux RND transporter permease subunit [gamma proteobacterium symbiont of Bathyaustriella thionipta]|nr:efflux RND transporter permease subunit [gamma proteobacterium symbiont of Bathyaustriella thionipta]
MGLAGNIAHFFIDSPLTPLLFAAALFIGLIGLIYTPRQEDPQISVPMIDIFVQYSGASAEDVANLAIAPLEGMMKEIPGVKHIYSASQHDQGIVTVRFKVNEEMGPSIVKVHDKLQSNMDKIPPGVSMPLVKPKGIDDVPVVTLTLWADGIYDSELRVLAHKVLQRLKEVPNTGQGFVVGGRTQQVRIEVLPERLIGFGISLDQVANAIRSANTEYPAGYLEQGKTSFKVFTGSFLKNIGDINQLVVGVNQGKPIYLRDIATIIDGPSEASELVSFYSGAMNEYSEQVANDIPAVTIALAKKAGSNGVTVAEDVIAKLQSLKGRLIPDNIHVTTTRDYGKTANDKVNELLHALVYAAVAVSILCWITIGARPAFVVVTVIPVVILITIWSSWALGNTINRVSMFALIFSIGILVDDATVVVENIFRRWLRNGETSLMTAVDAVREVGNPTIIATFTILAALLPMGFVSGMMGPYMRPIPVLGSVAMFFSLLAAFVFTPWLSLRLKPKMATLQYAEQHEKKIQDAIGSFYRPLLLPLIKNRFLGWLFLITIVVLFFLACSLFYTKAVTVKMLPFDNKPEFNILINMPEGTALLETANVARRLAETVQKKVPEVTAIQTYAGTASPFNFNGMVRHYYLRQDPWHADIQVMLVDKEKRERSSHELAESTRQLLTEQAHALGAKIAVIEMPPGPPVLQTMVAEIYGPDAVTRRQVATDMTRIFEQTPNLVDADNYIITPFELWHFKVNTEKALRHGVDIQAINRNIQMAMGGYKLGDIKGHTSLEPKYIVLQLPLEKRGEIGRLSNLPIPSSAGQMVPLTELGQFVKIEEQNIIYRKDLRPMEYVVGEMEGRLGAPIYGILSIEDSLKNYTAPDAVQITGTMTKAPEDDIHSGFEWSGEWVVTYETFRDMGLAFAAALVLIFGLLVLEFRNFILPSIIMAPIPLTLIGIIPGHWIMNAEFTATSMIGFIALAGIEVRSSILLVDFVKNEIHLGQDAMHAVANAGQIRMRPIWVTNLTMMVGAATILFDPIFQGMAISLLFGPIVATTLTLFVIPLGCNSIHKTLCPENPNSDSDDVCLIPD